MIKKAFVVAVEPDLNALGLTGDFKKNAQLISDMGYDGIELFVRDPEKLDVEELKKVCESNDLEVPAVGTGATAGIYGFTFTNPKKPIRRAAVERVNEFIELGNELEASIIIGSITGKETGDQERRWEYLVETLEECIRKAEGKETEILFEPINRYETNIANSIEEGINLIEEIGSNSLKLMADSFHMNIEEKSFTESLDKAEPYLEHMHFSDSNRLAPGRGHIDFSAIIGALKSQNYKGFISGEIITRPRGRSAAEQTIEFLLENV